MNRRWLVSVAVGLVLAAASVHGQDKPALGTDNEQLSYALGMDLGGQFRKMALEIDASIFARGLSDAMKGGATQLTEEQVKAAIARLQSNLKARQFQAQSGTPEFDPKVAEANRRAGEVFMAENARKDGVVVLPTGLQYKVLEAGDGKKPGLGDTVVCHYRGTLIDGTEFDSSYARKQPAVFPVKDVIAGWREALQLMPVGAKWQLFIPSELAYGQRGAGGKIGPSATLVFELELIQAR